MRWLPVIFFLMLFAMGANAQTAKDPFLGGVEMGIGYGNVIDFNLENNNLYREYLLQRLLWLPFHIGMVSAKYINPNKYVEFGFLFARRSSSFVYRHDYTSADSYGVGLPTLNLYGIDFPVKYFTYVGKILKQEMYAYGGIIPTWLVRPDGGGNGISEEYFRDFYISVCGGLCFDKGKSRLKLHAAMAVRSVVNSEYGTIPGEDRLYGARIYPFEIVFCYARMFR